MTVESFCSDVATVGFTALFVVVVVALTIGMIVCAVEACRK